ncbi:MAG TPA: hypothetical protein VIF15_04450 [Polyangiaceae bacterium]|jgi:hypothetical protein
MGLARRGVARLYASGAVLLAAAAAAAIVACATSQPATFAPDDGGPGDDASVTDATAMDAPAEADGAPHADATSDTGHDGPAGDASEAGDAGAGDGGSADAGSDAPLVIDASTVAAEPGLYYGGCHPLVAAGKVFFCSSPIPLDGTQGSAPAAVTVKSVSVVGGTPQVIGTISAAVCSPLCDFGSGSAGLFADSASLYWIDVGAGGKYTLYATPLTGGTPRAVATYTGMPNGEWTYDGTTFYVAASAESCPVSGCTATSVIGSAAADSGADGAAFPAVLQAIAHPPSGAGYDNFTFPGADPGPTGNLYFEVNDNGPRFISKVAKSGGTYDADAGQGGGLPPLAPNIAGQDALVLRSDGTAAYSLQWLASTTTVARVPTDGTAATNLATVSGFTFNELRIDSGKAYWVTAKRQTADGGGIQLNGVAVERAPTSGGGTTIIYASSVGTAGAPTNVALDSTFAYVTTESGYLVQVAK